MTSSHRKGPKEQRRRRSAAPAQRRSLDDVLAELPDLHQEIGEIEDYPPEPVDL